MLSERPGNPGTQPAGVAHNQIDLHSGLRGAVERARDVDVLERVHLHLDQARRAGALQRDLAIDSFQQGLLEQGRRRQNFFERAAGAIAGGEKIEQLRQVGADRVVAGQQSEVGIQARGARVIVAGADMRVAAQPVVILTHHQDHFAVSLEPTTP